MKQIAITHAARMPEIPELTGPADPILARTLPDLEAQVRRELDLTRYPAKSWVLPHLAPDGSRALDTLIVGGGQAGLATAFGLMQQRVTNITVIDENPAGAEGPWGTYARMETLRTRKHVGGIELGIPSLSFRAWYECQHGPVWADLYKIPTRAWTDYLAWYRRILSLPVLNDTRLIRLRPIDAAAPNTLLAADIIQAGTPRTIYARTILLATGIEGSGIRQIPTFISSALPKSLYAHTHESIDFAALKGRHVAVLGGSASAFDNAVAAAEAGAQVDLFHRAPSVMAAEPLAWGEFTGYLAHFADLPLLDRWRFSRKLRRVKTGPPVRTLDRAARCDTLTIHPGTGWTAVAQQGTRIHISTTAQPHTADFLILGTGYINDLTVVEELAEHLPLIATWADVFTPPEGEEDPALLAAPFVGANFETIEKIPGTAPWLAGLFNFSRGAGLSMGAMPIGLSGIKFGVPRVVAGVTKKLFLDDAPAYHEGMSTWQSSGDFAEP